MTPTQAQDLKRLAEAAPQGPWKFGISEWEPDTDTVVQVKPFDYKSGGYSDNPYIFDAKGNTVVGCDEYDVFSGAKVREYLTAMSPDVALQLLAERAMLLAALKHLLEDTQHAEHEDCEDGPCCVREARAAIAQCEGNQE